MASTPRRETKKDQRDHLMVPNGEVISIVLEREYTIISISCSELNIDVQALRLIIL